MQKRNKCENTGFCTIFLFCPKSSLSYAITLKKYIISNPAASLTLLQTTATVTLQGPYSPEESRDRQVTARESEPFWADMHRVLTGGLFMASLGSQASQNQNSLTSCRNPSFSENGGAIWRQNKQTNKPQINSTLLWERFVRPSDGVCVLPTEEVVFLQKRYIVITEREISKLPPLFLIDAFIPHR